MKFKRITKTTLISLLLKGSSYANADWSWEFRLGLAKAADRFAGEPLNIGDGVETGLAFSFLPDFAVYGGTDIYGFRTEDNIGVGDSAAIHFGLRFGMQLSGILADDANLAYRIRFGTALSQTTVFRNHDELGSTAFRTGWEVGIGMIIELQNQWQIVPEARYRGLPSKTLEILGDTNDINMSSTIVGIGIQRAFR